MLIDGYFNVILATSKGQVLLAWEGDGYFTIVSIMCLVDKPSFAYYFLFLDIHIYFQKKVSQ